MERKVAGLPGHTVIAPELAGRDPAWFTGDRPAPPAWGEV